MDKEKINEELDEAFARIADEVTWEGIYEILREFIFGDKRNV